MSRCPLVSLLAPVASLTTANGSFPVPADAGTRPRGSLGEMAIPKARGKASERTVSDLIWTIVQDRGGEAKSEEM